MKRPYPNPASILGKLKHLFVISVVLTAVRPVSAAISAVDFYGVPVEIICKLFDAFVTIAAALGALIIVVAGVTWIAAHDDPGKRKGAREAIVHTVIGLIIVSLAATIISGVTLKLSAGTAATTFTTLCTTYTGGS
jgi:hypothetical protein